MPEAGHSVCYLAPTLHASSCWRWLQDTSSATGHPPLLHGTISYNSPVCRRLAAVARRLQAAATQCWVAPSASCCSIVRVRGGQGSGKLWLPFTTSSTTAGRPQAGWLGWDASASMILWRLDLQSSHSAGLHRFFKTATQHQPEADSEWEEAHLGLTKPQLSVIVRKT